MVSLSNVEEQVLARLESAPEIDRYRDFVEDLLLKLKGTEIACPTLNTGADLLALLERFDESECLEEATFTKFILNLPIFQFIVICPERNREWMFWKESFSNFVGDRPVTDVLFVKREDPKSATDGVFNWMVTLCSNPLERNVLKSSQSRIGHKH